MEILILWGILYVLSGIIKIKTSVNLFKNIADYGYRIDRNRVSEAMNSLKNNSENNNINYGRIMNFVNFVCPILPAIIAYFGYSNNATIIIERLKVDDFLVSLTKEEEKEYQKNPNSIGAFLLNINLSALSNHNKIVENNKKEKTLKADIKEINKQIKKLKAKNKELYNQQEKIKKESNKLKHKTDELNQREYSINGILNNEEYSIKFRIIDGFDLEIVSVTGSATLLSSNMQKIFVYNAIKGSLSTVNEKELVEYQIQQMINKYSEDEEVSYTFRKHI